MKRSEAEQVLIGFLTVLHEEKEKALLDRVTKSLQRLKSMYQPGDDISDDFVTLLAMYEKQKNDIEARDVAPRRAVASDLFDAAMKSDEAPLKEERLRRARADARSSSTALIMGETQNQNQIQAQRDHLKRKPSLPSLDEFREIIQEMLSPDRGKSQSAATEFGRYIDMVNDVTFLEKIRDTFYSQLMEGARKKLGPNEKTNPAYEAEKKKYLKEGDNPAFKSLQEKIKEKNGRVIEYVPEKTALERKESSDALKVIMPKESRNPFRRHR